MESSLIKSTKLIIIAALLCFACWHFIPPLIKTQQINYKFGLAIILTQFPLVFALCITTIRYIVLLKISIKQYYIVCKSILLGFGLSLILPGRTAELIRPAYLSQHSKTSFKQSFMSLGVEKILDLLTFSFFTIAFLSHSFLSEYIHTTSILVMSSILAIFLLTLPKISPVISIIIKLIPFPKVSKMFQQILEALVETANAHILIKSFLISIIIFLCSWLTFYLYFYIVLIHPLPVIAVTMIMVLAIFSSIVPLLPAGFGVFEATTVFVLTKYNYNVHYALILAIGLHISQILTTSILGLIIACKEKIGISRLIKLSIKKLTA